MGFLKRNIKFIVVGIIIAIISGSLGVYVTATYFASDVSYTRNNETTNVSSALNDLYNRFSTYKNLSTTTNATASDILNGKTAYDNFGNLITGSNNMNVAFQSISAEAYKGSRPSNPSKSITLNKGRYLVIAGVAQGWVASSGSAEVTTTNSQNFGITCTQNFNIQYINTRKCKTATVGSNNVKTMLFEEYYVVEILNDNSTLTATVTETAASTQAYVLNITAIPYGIQ